MGLSYVDTSVINGLTYYYSISAVNGVGEGFKSSEVSATPSSLSIDSYTITAPSGSAGGTVSTGETFTVTAQIKISSGTETVSATITLPNGYTVTSTNPLSQSVGTNDEAFDWTVTAPSSASASAPISLSATANWYSTGTGSLNVETVDAASLTSGSSISASPSTVSVGGTITVTMTVHNSGSASAITVAPSSLTLGGTGSATPASGPTPASANIAGGASRDFTWTYIATSAGTVTFSGSATGSDQYSEDAVSTGALGPSTPVTVTAGSSTVTFTQTGLPPTRSWTATFNGVTKSSTAASIVFSNVAPGDYPWSIGTPISSGPGVQYSASPPSGSMNVPTQTAQSITFKKQYYLTMNTNIGAVSPGSGWYDAGSKVTISASAPTPIVGERYVWQYWSGSGPGSYTGSRNPASDAVTMNGPITERASWAHQYKLTISTLGVSSPYSAGVSIGGHSVGHASDASPFTTWINAGSSTGTIGVDSRVSDGSNVRYVFNSWSDSSTSNPRPSTQMNAPKTLTASYKTQYRITFSQSGVGYDFSGTVVNIDGSRYSRNSLPTSFWWDKSSVHTFQFISPLGVGRRGYAWSSTTGLSNLQAGTITVSTSGTVTGIYKK